jgi:hypothetical protein
MSGADFPRRRPHPVGTKRRERNQPVVTPVAIERATCVGEIEKFFLFAMVDISDLRGAVVGSASRAVPKARNVSQDSKAGTPSAGQCGKTP